MFLQGLYSSPWVVCKNGVELSFLRMGPATMKAVKLFVLFEVFGSVLHQGKAVLSYSGNFSLLFYLVNGSCLTLSSCFRRWRN